MCSYQYKSQNSDLFTEFRSTTPSYTPKLRFAHNSLSSCDNNDYYVFSAKHNWNIHLIFKELASQVIISYLYQNRQILHFYHVLILDILHNLAIIELWHLWTWRDNNGDPKIKNEIGKYSQFLQFSFHVRFIFVCSALLFTFGGESAPR